MSKEQLVGTWKLLSNERHSDGLVTYPYGENSYGFLVYDAHGNMAVQLTRPDRAPFVSGDVQGTRDVSATDEELRTAYTSYVAYFGRYEVDDEKKTVTHHVAGSL